VKKPETKQSFVLELTKSHKFCAVARKIAQNKSGFWLNFFLNQIFIEPVLVKEFLL
jgi:predicted nuclease of restriction endonuclease-like (RecB) superfamily